MRTDVLDLYGFYDSALGAAASDFIAGWIADRWGDGAGLDFGAFLTALVVGYEIAHRAGVALHAKPSVAAECELRVNFGDLTALLYLQGYARDAFVA